VNPIDMLRQSRSSGYGAKKGDGESARSFAITEDDNIPDGPCCVKAYGTAQDGKFVIERIEPDQGKSNEDAIMVKTPTQVVPG
jgi:hypothetical protein